MAIFKASTPVGVECRRVYADLVSFLCVTLGVLVSAGGGATGSGGGAMLRSGDKGSSGGGRRSSDSAPHPFTQLSVHGAGGMALRMSEGGSVGMVACGWRDGSSSGGATAVGSSPLTYINPHAGPAHHAHLVIPPASIPTAASLAATQRLFRPFEMAAAMAAQLAAQPEPSLPELVARLQHFQVIALFLRVVGPV